MALAFNAGPAIANGTCTTTGTVPAQTAVSTITSASATYPAGALVCVFVGSAGPQASDTATPKFHVASITGTAGLTFTLAATNQTNPGEGFPDCEIWTSVVPAGGTTGTIIVNMSGGSHFTNGAQIASAAFCYFTDGNTPTKGVTGSGSSFSGTPSMALTGLTIGSFVIATTTDISSGAGAGVPGTAQTMIGEGYNGTVYALHAWRTTAAIAGTTQTMSLPSPSGTEYISLALEIKANAGAVANPLPGGGFFTAA